MRLILSLACLVLTSNAEPPAAAPATTNLQTHVPVLSYSTMDQLLPPPPPRGQGSYGPPQSFLGPLTQGLTQGISGLLQSLFTPQQGPYGYAGQYGNQGHYAAPANQGGWGWAPRAPPAKQGGWGWAAPVVKKNVFVHVAADESFNAPATQVIRAQGPSEKQVNIIFVKAPAMAPPKQTQVILPTPPETKTLVYVLLRKPEGENSVSVQAPEPTKPPKPEVFFIRYKEGKDKVVYGPPATTYGVPTANSYAAPPVNTYGAPPAVQTTSTAYGAPQESYYSVPQQTSYTETKPLYEKPPPSPSPAATPTTTTFKFNSR